jgi:hypothetical protein
MDENSKFVLMILGSVILIFAFIFAIAGIGVIYKDHQYKETIKDLDAKQACGYTCYYNWPQTASSEQYKDCLDYCKEGVNETKN